MTKRTQPTRKPSRLNFYDQLESRQLLAAVADPFADNAVTVSDMELRAQTVPFVEGEIVVAIATEASAGDAKELVSQIDWTTWIGVDATPMRQLMSVERDLGQSVTLVHLDLGEADIFSAMRALDQNESVMWSAPNFVHFGEARDYIPNDPDYGDQYHHPLMRNDHAWDIEMGEASVVIGITDDGVELDHEDLQANIWTNAGEIPNNGIDDDGNGYVDDINAWDFAADDNDPNPDSGTHGTHVGGITAASSDNGIGIAGVSLNSTIMALKFYEPGLPWTAALINETFAYAVDNGAQIINTSYSIDFWWGDPVFTAGMQYAHDNNTLHINSAGNNNTLNSARHNFDQTLLVANTDSADQRNFSSNYGYGIDVSAPGTQILSTVTGNGYANFTGTSMAAPAAAGVAALIWSHNPTWTNVQVAAQLVATADSIDHLNPGFEGYLGSGRTNALRAVTETLPAPQIENITGLPESGTWVDDLTIDSFALKFDQIIDLDAANDTNNYRLTAAGDDGIFGTSDDQSIPLTHENYMLGTNQFEFEIPSGGLGYGQYRLTISNLVNPFGTAMDGNSDGFEGDAYVHDFWIVTPDHARVELNQSHYQLNDVVVINLYDDNLSGTSPVVSVTSSAGETELVTLTLASPNHWSGTITTQQGLPVASDGVLNVQIDDLITVQYVDPNDGFGGSFASSASATIINITTVSSDDDQPLAGVGTTVSSIDIADNGNIADLKISLDITHGRTSDLSAVLISPSGNRIDLFQNVGGFGENFTGTIFDAEASVSINDAGAPFRGRYLPVGDLASLEGVGINGTWRLEITDDTAGESGMLNSWSLQYELLTAVQGTDGDDVVVVHMNGPTIEVFINDEKTEIPTEAGNFVFDALGGNDTITIYADNGDNTAVIRDKYVQLEGIFNLFAQNVETINVHGGGGKNHVQIFGTREDELFRTFAAGARLIGSNFEYAAMGFQQVNAFGFGGDDRAVLVDTPANDRLFANQTFARMTNMSTGDFINARDFNTLTVHANQGGFDIAQFAGSENDESVTLTSDVASLQVGVDNLRAIGFERTWVDGGGGDDSAKLIGSPNDDRFISHPTQSYLRGDGFFNQVLNFGNVEAIGGEGHDLALLWDTHGDDDLYATPDYAVLTSLYLQREASGFEEITAFGSAGFDRATLVGSAGSDRYVARSESAFLKGDDYLHMVQRFNSVTADSAGGDDVAVFFGSIDDERFFGQQGRSLLDGANFFNQALNFRRVQAFAGSAGFDQATLIDSADDDTFVGRDNVGSIYSDNYSIQVFATEEVVINSTHGGRDQWFAGEDLTYDLRVLGDWD